MKRLVWFSALCVLSLLVVAVFLQIGVPGLNRTPLQAYTADGRTWASPAKKIVTAKGTSGALHVRRKMLQKVSISRAEQFGLKSNHFNISTKAEATSVEEDVILSESLTQDKVVKIMLSNGVVERIVNITSAQNTDDSKQTVLTSAGADYEFSGEHFDLSHVDAELDIATTRAVAIDARSKWQMTEVDKFCNKYHLNSINFTLPEPNSQARQNLYRHVLFDDQQKLIFTYIPKVGCTHTRRFMFVLSGTIPLKSIHWKSISEEKYLGPGIQQSSFVNPSLSDRQRLLKLITYWKFTFLRNPLERLVSAYRNKLSNPLVYSEISNQTFQMIKRSIFEAYYPEKLKQWINAKGSYDLVLDFQTYIRWIVDTPNKELNEHFTPMLHIAQPCRIRYDFYGNFKNFSSDMRLVMDKFQVPSEYFYDESYYNTKAEETRSLLEEYYSTVSSELKAALCRDFHAELDFYYHLFPEERESHIDLLATRNKYSQYSGV